MSVIVTVESPELARALGNALAFIPARSAIQVALIEIWASVVRTSGTDGYAAGTDFAPATGHAGTPDRWLVAKDDLVALDRYARESKKAQASLSAYGCGNLSLQASDRDPIEVPAVPAGRDTELIALPSGVATASDWYAAALRALGNAEKRTSVIPGSILLDPALLSRFSKVRADKTERKADFLMGDGSEPVLVKIGPTFKGLIAPIDREVHAERVGEDGLW